MLAVAAAIVFGIIELVQSADDGPSTRTASTSTTSERANSGNRTTITRPASDATPSASPTRASDLPTISIGDLPTEALDTLVLIRDGGPYPYRQDDGVFGNREGLLPARTSGYYREPEPLLGEERGIAAGRRYEDHFMAGFTKRFG